VLTWDDGSKYEGLWKDDCFHGKGTFYSEEGKVLLKGIWEKGKFKGWLFKFVVAIFKTNFYKL